MPIIVILGLAATTVIWLIILITESYSRWVGLGWMAGGLILYYLYRRRRRQPPAHILGDREKLS